MRLPDDYEDHGGGLTPTVISAIVAVTIFAAVLCKGFFYEYKRQQH